MRANENTPMKRNQCNPFERKSRSEVLSEYDKHPSNYQSRSRINEIGQAELLIQMERLVRQTLSSKEPSFRIEKLPSGQWITRSTSIGRKLTSLLPHLGKFGSVSHQYSEEVLALLDAYWMTLSVFRLNYRGRTLDANNVPIDVAEACNCIADKIRMNAQEAWFRRVGVVCRNETKDRTKSVTRYIRSILGYRARTLVVRIDAGYRKESRAALTIDQVYDHLDKLLYLKDQHSAFNCLTGYSWSMEQGERDGYHLHLAFFFNGSEVCHDIIKGYELGRLWVEQVTEGKGFFENCNASKERYGERLGIGMIHRASEEECANAIDCMAYLTKGGRFSDRTDQYLRMKPLGRRIFGTGLVPSIEEKRGRPSPPAPWLEACMEGSYTKDKAFAQ